MSYGRMPRKEDARFMRGRGRFVDDIALPGMLHAAVLRSPYAHARIVGVDASAAESHPKVAAVITGEMLAGAGLAWMPTLTHDVQAVLATDKVRYQGQEVAFVVAEDRYAARDALALIEVEYEPLAPVVDARRALDADAPAGPRREAGDRQPHLRLGVRRRGGHRRRVRRGRARSACDMLYPRVHPAPLETCGTVASMDPVERQAHGVRHHPGPARAPRPLLAGRRHPRAQDPDRGPGHRRRLRQQGRDVPRLRLRGGRLDRHRRAGEVDRGPLREPDEPPRSPATTTCAARSRPPRRRITGAAGAGARRPRRVQRHRAAVEVPGRVLPHLHRLLRRGRRALRRHRRLHEQGAGRGGLRLLVPGDRGVVPGGAAGRRAAPTRPGPGRRADGEPAAARAVPVPLRRRLGVRLRRLPGDAAQAMEMAGLRRAAQGAGAGRARRAGGS